jgi:hypothetical protein
VGDPVSAASRAFGTALRQATDRQDAHALVVVNADSSLTLITHPELDRARLAEALVALAFTLADERQLHETPTERGADNHI